MSQQFGPIAQGRDQKGENSPNPCSTDTTHGLPSHIPALDAVRGLAIIAVTLFRFSKDDLGNLSRLEDVFWQSMRQGARGVDLFFVLSGFLITGILFDAKGTRNYFRDFYIRRTLRVFPLYYGVLFLCFVLLPLTLPRLAEPYQQTAPYQGWLWLYGANIIQALEGKWMLGWFEHFWSLSVEEHFYLIWPFVVFWSSRKAAMMACAIFTIGATACRLVLHAQGVNLVALETLTPCRLDALALGGFLALVARGPGGVRAVVPWTIGFLAVGLACLPLIVWRHRIFLPLSPLAIACFCAVLLMWAVLSRPSTCVGRFWNSKFLCFFGKYSYGMYVFQNLLIPLFPAWFASEVLAQRFGSVFFGRWLHILLASLVTLGVALVSWHLYEKHFLRLKEVFAPKVS